MSDPIVTLATCADFPHLDDDDRGLPDALRASSSALLTDLTALDYDALERTLEFLANNSAAVAAQALPGQWNAASGTYTVTDASRAAMQTFFNVSPTEAQASSFSEP